MNDFKGLYDFWFRKPETTINYFDERVPFWFMKNESVDKTIRTQFAGLLALYKKGELEHWKTSPQGMISLIVLLDQVPRNAFRGTPESFAYDQQAIDLTLALTADNQDYDFQLAERIFLYLPLEHSEDLQLQKLSVDKFSELYDEMPADLHKYALMTLDYAKRHEDIISRFGRFPHRNDILGRPSTPEELLFLQEPNSRF